MKFIKKLFLFLFLLTGLIAYFIFTNLTHKNLQDVSYDIAKGTSLKKIAAELAARGVVKNKYFFEYYVRLKKQDALIKFGEYRFAKNIEIDAVIQKLVKGEFIQYFFTIPEGYHLKQIQNILVTEKKLMTQEEFAEQITRVSLLKDVSEAQNLEGFLFPDTYAYTKKTTPAQLIEAMVTNFYKKVDAGLIKQAKDKGLSLYQLVTFASLVEKETGVGYERPLIAGVFYNRLAKGMLLQTDPAVIYGIENYDGNIRRSDLKKDTPYNTYTRPGLPKGPIASVGLEAIKAVIFPTKTSYFYFVAKQDRSHYFSQTLEQHNRAVQYYQLKRGVEPAPIPDTVVEKK